MLQMAITQQLKDMGLVLLLHIGLVVLEIRP
jgi:hypothetical protein